MNTRSLTTVVGAPQLLSGIKKPAAFANLLRKEFRESRGMLVAGLWIFWVMPFCLAMFYTAFIDWQHEVMFGFAWALLFGVGWLYAVVVGAQTVCRDWGRAEEHFLLAQPISPRAIVWAKLIAGAMVVLGVTVFSGLGDLCLAELNEEWRGDRDLLFVVFAAGLLLCVLIGGFVIALATAVVTRQALTAVLVASMVLLMWAVAPLLSARLLCFYPRILLPQYPPEWGLLDRFGRVFLILVFLCIAVSITIALVASRRERVIRIGHKPLAWTVAICILALFSAAMNEVGSSLIIRDRVQVFAPEEWGTGFGHTVFARKDDLCFVLSRHQKARNFEFRESDIVMPIICFRLTDDGSIKDFQRAELWPPAGGRSQEIPLFRELVEAKINKNGDLVVTGVVDRRGMVADSNLCRLRLHWPEDASPQILSQTVAGLSKSRMTGHLLTSYVSTDRFAYLVYATPTLEGENRIACREISSWPRTLYIYEWSNGPEAPLLYEIQLEPGWDIRRFADFLAIRGEHRIVVALPADNPETVASRLKETARRNLWEGLTPGQSRFLSDFGSLLFETLPRGRNAVWDDDRQLCFRSTVWGLEVIGSDTVDRWETFGQYRASPLALMYRRLWTPALFLIDSSLLTEQYELSLTTYDVSDPARPRRSGFFHLSSSSPFAQYFATDRYLLLIEGNWLTVLDRPSLK